MNIPNIPKDIISAKQIKTVKSLEEGFSGPEVRDFWNFCSTEEWYCLFLKAEVVFSYDFGSQIIVPVVLPELLVELVGLLLLEGLLDADPPSYVDKGPKDAACDELGNEGEGN